MSERREIPEDLVLLIEGPSAGLVATCDASRRPEIARVRGARVSDTRRTVTAFLPTIEAGRTFDNLSHDRRIAVGFTHLLDYRSVQLKGEVLSIRPTTAGERELQAHHKREFTTDAALAGVARALNAQVSYWPSTAVEFRIDEIFMQTPGRGAGRPWL